MTKTQTGRKTKPNNENALTIPTEFEKAALAFPEQADRIIAIIESRDEAKEGVDKASAMVEYAKRIRADTRVLNAIQYGKLKLVAKLAEYLPSQQGKRFDKLPKPGLGGFTAPTLSKYRKVGKYQNALPDYWEAAEVVQKAEDEYDMTIRGFLDFVGAGGVLATRHGKGVVAWYTPKEYIKAARTVLSEIDLDPASSKTANKTVKAKTYYTKTDDGLEQAWSGRVFLNPPYKMPDVGKFVAKLLQHIDDGSVPAAILLTNNNTDTRWWQSAAAKATGICFTCGRISFYNDAGEWSSPTNGQTLMYFGSDGKRFAEIFGEKGLCYCDDQKS